MPEYFIVSQSFAAPFFSDTSEGFVSAESPKQALEQYASEYKHPCGLYSAVCFADATAYHKNGKPLAMWLSNHKIEKQALTAPLRGGYSYLGNGPGDFEINGTRYLITNPKQGRVLDPSEVPGA